VGKLLRTYYPAQPDAVDETLIAAISRDGTDPGAPNVIASGQKLPPQRPLNEVLSAEHGYGGPVLVPQGADDPLSGAKRSQERAAIFARLRDGVTVRLLNAGHCPHDEVPEQVAQAMVEWWPSTKPAKAD
jgi:pimeloyl-ACP methyl ester carboxylesterase